jgi:hypothetical protein
VLRLDASNTAHSFSQPGLLSILVQ